MGGQEKTAPPVTWRIHNANEHQVTVLSSTGEVRYFDAKTVLRLLGLEVAP